MVVEPAVPPGTSQAPEEPSHPNPLVPGDLPPAVVDESTASPEGPLVSNPGIGPSSYIRIAQIDIVPGFNARHLYSDDDPSLDELRNSIRARGLMQPVVVMPHADGRYQLIAGERRFRCVRSLGESEIACVIRQIADAAEARVDMLVENLQRGSLSAIEEAGVYKYLVEQGWSRHRIADSTGKGRSYIVSMLRLSSDIRLAELVTTQGLPVGIARELTRLFDDQHQEIVPGVLNYFLKWIQRTKPTRSEVASEITSVLAKQELPKVSERTVVRRTIADRVRATVMPKLDKAPLIELQALRVTLQELSATMEEVIAQRTASSS